MSTSSSSKSQVPFLRKKLVIIGAGPHALALITKVLETSIDTFEEIESNNIMFGESNGRFRAKLNMADLPRSLIKPRKILRQFNKRQRGSKQLHSKILKDIMVIDPNGPDWLGQWKKQFATLGIDHLRSTFLAHPGPVDGNELQVFAEDLQRRRSDMKTLSSLEKSSSYGVGFEVPSTSLFNDFCDDLVNRFHLKGTVTRGVVTEVIPYTTDAENATVNNPSTTDAEKATVNNPSTSDAGAEVSHSNKPFLVTYASGEGVTQKILADAVVCAIGPLGIPSVPSWASGFNSSRLHRNPHCSLPLHGNPHSHRNLPIFHSNEIISCGCCPPEPLSSCCSKPFPGFEEHQTVVIIGAGQTAGHLALRILKTNEDTNVVILCRRDEISLRQFDFPLEWMGTKRNVQLAKYWSSEMSERVDTVASLKNGGSMNPEVYAALQAFVKKGRLEIRCNTEVVTCPALHNCSASTCSDFKDHIEGEKKPLLELYLNTGEKLFASQVWLATGTSLSPLSHPLFSRLAEFEKPEMIYSKDKQQEVLKLTTGLRWKKDVNFFVLGAYALNRLGPGALNLMGAMGGAARVASELALLGIGLRPKHVDNVKTTPKGRRRKKRR